MVLRGEDLLPQFPFVCFLFMCLVRTLLFLPLHTQRGQLKALDVGPGRGSEELLVPVDAAGAATGSVALTTDFV